MDFRELFDRLGLRGASWTWRAWRWQRRWEAWGAHWREQRQHVLYRHKVCACGALVDREDRRCPRCGRAVAAWSVQAGLRAVGLLLPAQGPVTAVLLAANGLYFVVLLLVGGLRGLMDPSLSALYTLGSLVPAAFWQGEYWRLITYGYLHIGLIHLVFNLVALSQIGPTLEEQVGGARYFTAYTLALLGGGAADVLLRGTSVVTIAGASGALFGLIGLGLAYAHSYGGLQGRAQRDFFLKWALYSFAFGYLVGADNLAHGGGFVAGLVLGWGFELQQRGGDRGRTVWTVAAGLLALLTAAAFLWMALRHLR